MLAPDAVRLRAPFPPTAATARDYIPCYVVNLASATARREAMQRKLDALQVPFEFRQATDGRRIPDERRHIFVDETRAAAAYGSLSPGEIGCALSHIAIYLEMVEHGIPCAIVLEDDVDLAPDFPELIDCSRPDSIPRQFAPNQAVMVQLTHVRRVYRRGAKPVANAYCIHRPHSDVWLTSAYFITLEAARRMAEGLYPVWTVADHWRTFEQHGFVKLHALVPNCAWESDLGQQSSLAAERVRRPRKSQGLRRKLARWVDEVLIRPLLVMKTRELRHDIQPEAMRAER